MDVDNYSEVGDNLRISDLAYMQCMKQNVHVFCAIWSYPYKLENVRNIHGEVPLLVKVKVRF